MRCPVCRAETSLNAPCRRCKADLSLLAQLEAGRRRLLDEAARCLTAGEAGRARRHADQAQQLRPGADAARLVALALLLERDYPAALAAYSSAAAEASSPQ